MFNDIAVNAFSSINRAFTGLREQLGWTGIVIAIVVVLALLGVGAQLFGKRGR